jgi:hypothetical protein
MVLLLSNQHAWPLERFDLALLGQNPALRSPAPSPDPSQARLRDCRAGTNPSAQLRQLG